LLHCDTLCSVQIKIFQRWKLTWCCTQLPLELVNVYTDVSLSIDVIVIIYGRQTLVPYFIDNQTHQCCLCVNSVKTFFEGTLSTTHYYKGGKAKKKKKKIPMRAYFALAVLKSLCMFQNLVVESVTVFFDFYFSILCI
jgi:hypothetical protein